MASLSARSLGDAYEQLLAAARVHADPARRARGAFYTPALIIEHVLDVAMPRSGSGSFPGAPGSGAPRILDPACGTGHFLASAARRIPDVPGVPRRALLARALAGVDIDPIAVELCRLALWLEAADPEAGPADFAASVRVADALHCAPPPVGCTPLGHAAVEPQSQPTPSPTWGELFPGVMAAGGFTAIVGNPPFLNQLETLTVSDRARAARLREWSGGAIARYADTAAAFLLLSTRLLAPGGIAALVQPLSTLSAADSRPIRAAILADASLVGLWTSQVRLFPDASVYTCVPVIQRKALPSAIGNPAHPLARAAHLTTLNRWEGPEARPAPALQIDPEELRAAPTWSHLAAGPAGPAIHIPRARTFADVARATADFRDQYYGLAPALVEHDDVAPTHADRRLFEGDYPRLLTTGLIDFAACAWGVRPTRVLKRAWSAPRVSRAVLSRDPALNAWLNARLVPKVLLATQTRILEAWVDEPGATLPSVPLITVTPRDGIDLWHLAAALAAPPLAVLALRTYAGAALHADAIKLSARQVLELPLPADLAAWQEAADCFRALQHMPATPAFAADGRSVLPATHSERLSLARAYAQAAAAAFNLDSATRAQVVGWWLDRYSKALPAGRDRSARPVSAVVTVPPVSPVPTAA